METSTNIWTNYAIHWNYILWRIWVNIQQQFLFIDDFIKSYKLITSRFSSEIVENCFLIFTNLRKPTEIKWNTLHIRHLLGPLLDSSMLHSGQRRRNNHKHCLQHVINEKGNKMTLTILWIQVQRILRFPIPNNLKLLHSFTSVKNSISCWPKVIKFQPGRGEPIYWYNNVFN